MVLLVIFASPPQEESLLVSLTGRQREVLSRHVVLLVIFANPGTTCLLLKGIFIELRKQMIRSNLVT